MSGTSIDAQLRRQRAETPVRRQGVRITDGVNWTQRPACACGCGELVRPDKTGRAWSKWLPNHHRRGEKL